MGSSAPAKRVARMPGSSDLTYRLQAMAARAVGGGLRALGLDAASNLMAGLARMIGPRLGPSRVARRNLAVAGYDEAEAERILAGMWDNLGRTIAEYPFLKEICDHPRLSRIEIADDRSIAAAREAGKGGIIFSAHMGNWEILPYLSQVFDIDTLTFYREPNNPYIREVVEDWRPAAPTAMIRKGLPGMKQALAGLAKGKFIGILIDQKYNQGVEVDFLGRPTLMSQAIAVLARRFRCPVIPIHAMRTTGSRFRVTTGSPVEFDFDLPPELFLADATRRAVAVIEGWIREQPEQWLWVHKIWGKDFYR